MRQLLDAARYAAVNAQIRGLFTRMIPAQMWQQLLAAVDLPDVLRILRQSWYAPVLAALPDDLWDAVPLERALWTHQAAAARQPRAFLLGATRDLLDWYWRRFEVENLKAVLRTVHYGIAPTQALPSLIDLGAASSVPWQSLLSADSIPTVAARLAGSWLGTALARGIEQYRREQTLFVLEVALDLAYYQRILKALSRLHGRDAQAAVRFLGLWLEGQNLLWAYRYRIYARFSPEEILNYTLQRGLRVNADLVRAIALGASLKEIAATRWASQLPGLATIAELPERAALPALELQLQRQLWAQAEQTRQGDALQLGIVLAYEVLIESEVRDLIVVIENKTSSEPHESLIDYLVGERRADVYTRTHA